MKKEDLRIVFMGTPEFAVETLKELVDHDYNVVAVVTQPDKPVGRHGSILQPSEVKRFALAHNLPVLQPVKMKDPLFIEQLRSYHANLQVVVAFRMLPEIVWSMPQYGTFNVHAALLPQYRGAAPINWAIINGEKTTGVTTFFLDKDIDTGRVIMQKPFDIPFEADAEYVYNGLMHLGAQLCLDTLDKIIETDGKPETLAQGDMGADVILHQAPKIFKETCKINWSKSAVQVHNFIRGLSPYPGTWTMLIDASGKEQVMKIFKGRPIDIHVDMLPGTIFIDSKQMMIVTGGEKNVITVEEVQLAGKKRMKAIDFINGMKGIECYCVK